MADDSLPSATFADLGLHPAVSTAIASLGYSAPSAIQAEMIPHMLAGVDVLGQAQTGTGKTAAFALPILSRIDLAVRTTQVIVLAPTRELAIQVAASFKKYGAGLPGFGVVAIYGGQSYEIQLRALKRGVQVVVGTPGRIIDHINRGTLDLSNIKTLVLDEADEMLNMGFVDDVEFVLQQTSAERQVCLFSATMPPAIRSIAQRYLKSPLEIRIKNRTQTVTAVRQRCLQVMPRDKPEALVRILETEDTDAVLVFARTRGATVEIAEGLARRGYATAALNGDIQQRQRERTIEDLKAGRLNIVVATDVAARGLDVQRISHVINYDMPPDNEAYIHRIGRTGRAGRSGDAILFATRSELGKLRSIERTTRQPIESMPLPSLDAVNLRRVDRFKAKIAERIAQPGDLEFWKTLLSSFQEDSGQPIELIASALAAIAQGENPLLLANSALGKSRSPRPDYNEDSHREDRSSGRGQERRGPARAFTPPEEGMTRYRIKLGSRDRVAPGNLVGAITNTANVPSTAIGRIYIYDGHSTVDLRSDIPAESFAKLQGIRLSGKPLTFAPEGTEPQQAAKPAGPRIEKSESPAAAKPKQWMKTKRPSPNHGGPRAASGPPPWKKHKSPAKFQPGAKAATSAGPTEGRPKKKQRTGSTSPGL